MKHIALVLPDLRAGGTERLTIDLARSFRERGAQVDLVLLKKRGEFLAMVPDGVRIIDLDVDRLRSAILPLRRYIRQERPDAVLAAMWPLTSIAVIAATGLQNRPRVIVSDHSPLEWQYGSTWKSRLALHASIRLTYPAADAIVAVSQGLATELTGTAKLPPDRAATIYNPIPPPLRSKQGVVDWGPCTGTRILSVGSLKPVKNFSLLLRAFAPLAHAGEAVLAIVGTGPMEAELRALAAELGLGERLRMPGYSATPGDWYGSADLFALASDYEGFGNVLVEALHCGLPVVSTNCPYGPAEIMEQGRWGQLVAPGDQQALTAALRTAATAAVNPCELGKRAGSFSVERAVEKYWSLLCPSAEPAIFLLTGTNLLLDD